MARAVLWLQLIYNFNKIIRFSRLIARLND